MHKGSKGIIVYLKVGAIYIVAMGVPKKEKNKLKFRIPSKLMVL
jgi:hypothetical protein